MTAAGGALHRVDAQDDVAIALIPLEAGREVAFDSETLVLQGDIPLGHKVALRDISVGAVVRKYGWPIGRATQDIPHGAHVHTHNLATLLMGEETYAFTRFAAPPRAPSPRARTFEGYLRDDGRVGTRNEIWILPTVGCVARTAQRIAGEAHARFAGRGVDGVYAFAHPYGCSQLGDDHAATRTILADLARHPNAGGVLVVGLGCENNQLAALLQAAEGLDPERGAAFAAQLSEDEHEEGLAAVERLVAQASHDRRTTRPFGDLVIGLKCGGSDGFSGVTANPLLGRVADAVTAEGGAAILTEIPEVFGAERVLMARAVDQAVFDGAVEVVNGFKRYFIAHGQPVYENPSPGNIAGGITTLEEKSLGAVQKAGRAPLTQVLRYGERVGAGARGGVTLLEAPGNDAVSTTALTAAGANVTLFTTGRGTPLGSPAPTLKIATNTGLAQRKPGWIDFDAGAVLTTGAEPATEALLDLIAATASGAATRAEANGEREIALWKRGVTL